MHQGFIIIFSHTNRIKHCVAIAISKAAEKYSFKRIVIDIC